MLFNLGFKFVGKVLTLRQLTLQLSDGVVEKSFYSLEIFVFVHKVIYLFFKFQTFSFELCHLVQ